MPSDETPHHAQPLPQDLIDALQYAFGDRRTRGLFAKGLLIEGRFQPASKARQLCSARLFAHEEAYVLARFSNFAGIPTMPDRSPLARPHGLAVKLSVPKEPELDIVAHSFDGFPTSTIAEFRDLLLAIGLSPQTAPSPTALDRYLSTHPAARDFFASQGGPPDSYAALRYYGVNAFKMTNADGEPHHVRYRFIPRTAEHTRSANKTARRRANYLNDELARRIRVAPIVFDWFAQIAEAGDPIDDPSRPWPSQRRLELLGSLSLLQLSENQVEADQKTLFLPANLPDGICAADPMLLIRNAVYPLSYRRRQ